MSYLIFELHRSPYMSYQPFSGGSCWTISPVLGALPLSVSLGNCRSCGTESSGTWLALRIEVRLLACIRATYTIEPSAVFARARGRWPLTGMVATVARVAGSM